MANTYTEDQLNSSERCFYCGLVQKLKLFRGIINGAWVCERCLWQRRAS